jgi:hypothetical protein
MISIQRQFIFDATGVSIGVILPMEEFALVKDILEERLDSATDEHEDEMLQLMTQAAFDPLFLADMNEVMSDFSHVDSEWWESSE